MIFSMSAKISPSDLSALTTLALNSAAMGLVFALKFSIRLRIDSSVSSKLFLAIQFCNRENVGKLSTIANGVFFRESIIKQTFPTIWIEALHRWHLRRSLQMVGQCRGRKLRLVLCQSDIHQSKTPKNIFKRSAFKRIKIINIWVLKYPFKLLTYFSLILIHHCLCQNIVNDFARDCLTAKKQMEF
jgi:hypothetical protein